jgi:hypothetical protein
MPVDVDKAGTSWGKCIGLVALGVALGAGGTTAFVLVTDRMRTKEERQAAIAKRKLAASAGATK